MGRWGRFPIETFRSNTNTLQNHQEPTETTNSFYVFFSTGKFLMLHYLLISCLWKCAGKYLMVFSPPFHLSLFPRRLIWQHSFSFINHTVWFHSWEFRPRFVFLLYCTRLISLGFTLQFSEYTKVHMPHLPDLRLPVLDTDRSVEEQRLTWRVVSSAGF